MRNDYETVRKALGGGVDPAMLCATCPWDRHCITPPAMTSSDVERQIAEAGQRDEQRAAELRASGADPGLPAQTLLTAMIVAGRDTSAEVCPVFALRLKSSGGRRIADQFRSMMQGWDDQA